MHHKLSTAEAQLTALKGDKDRLTNNLDNQALNHQRSQAAYKTTAAEASGVTDIQLKQLEKMVDALTKDNQSEYPPHIPSKAHQSQSVFLNDDVESREYCVRKVC